MAIKKLISRDDIENRRFEIENKIREKKDTIHLRNQRVLELYLCGNDRRLRVIGDIVGVTDGTVSDTIEQYFKGKITFDRGECQIVHSSINYEK